MKAAVFDIDNTLYDFDRANRISMDALGVYVKENFGMEPEETAGLVKKCVDIVTERTGENCAAQHNRLLRFQCFLEQIGSRDYRKAMEMYHIYWDTLLEVMEPEPGIISLLSRLKRKGVRLGIGSDMTAYIQYKKLERLGVLQYLDFIVTSEEAGAEKPTPRFFELCVKKAGCRPEECVFIGDSLKKDVIGSAQSGLIGTWYHPAKADVCAGQSTACREICCPVITSFDDYLRGEGQEED